MGAVAAIAGAVGTVVGVIEGANQREQQRRAIDAQRRAADERMLLEQYAAISNQQAALQSAKLANLQLYNQAITDLQKLDIAGQQALAEQAAKISQIDAFITQQRLGMSAATAEGLAQKAQTETQKIATQMQLYEQETQRYTQMAQLNNQMLLALQNKDAQTAAQIARQLAAVSQAIKPGITSGLSSRSDKTARETFDRLTEIRTAEQMLKEQGAIDTSQLNQNFVDELKAILTRIGEFQLGSLQQQGNLNLSAGTIAANLGLDTLVREGIANKEAIELLRQVIPIDYQIKAGQNLINAENAGQLAASNMALARSTNRATQAQLDAQAPRGNFLSDLGTIIGGVAPVVGLFNSPSQQQQPSNNSIFLNEKANYMIDNRFKLTPFQPEYSIDSRFKFTPYDTTPVTNMLNLYSSNFVRR